MQIIYYTFFLKILVLFGFFRITISKKKGKNEKTNTKCGIKTMLLFMIHNMKQGPKIQTHLSWARQREII